MVVSDLNTESKRGRGRERAGTMSTAPLPTQSAEIQSSAQKLTESRQNAAASTGKHRQTQQRHGIWPRNTNSKWQQEESKAIGCRNALKLSHNLDILKGSYFLFQVTQHRDNPSLRAAHLKWVSRRYLILTLIQVTLSGHCE